MMVVGDVVRVLHPFGETYTGEYVITNIDENGGVFLGGIEGGFDPIYLEKV
jgi:hypothetical protein